ncbi:hypothetical protein KAW64_17200 [bacterium]|nr:hypothetical protein [bacterium]
MMDAQTGLSVESLVTVIEEACNIEDAGAALDVLNAELPLDTRHQVLALADVDAFFASNVAALTEGRKAFDTQIASEKAKASVARSLMIRILQHEGATTVRSGRVTVSLRAGRERMKCVDLKKVEDVFIRVKREANIALAKEVMHETGDIPAGFEYERGEPSVNITRKDKDDANAP